jgi:hypothetical protein
VSGSSFDYASKDAALSETKGIRTLVIALAGAFGVTYSPRIANAQLSLKPCDGIGTSECILQAANETTVALNGCATSTAMFAPDDQIAAYKGCVDIVMADFRRALPACHETRCGSNNYCAASPVSPGGAPQIRTFWCCPLGASTNVWGECSVCRIVCPPGYRGNPNYCSCVCDVSTLVFSISVNFSRLTYTAFASTFSLRIISVIPASTAYSV